MNLKDIKFGKKLKRVRTDAGVSLDDAARRIGCCKSSVVYYENDTISPSTQIAFHYSHFFQIPLNELFGRKAAKQYKKRRASISFKSHIKAKNGVSLGASRMRFDRNRKGIRLQEMADKINESFSRFDLDVQKLGKVETGTSPLRYEHAVAYSFVLSLLILANPDFPINDFVQ